MTYAECRLNTPGAEPSSMPITVPSLARRMVPYVRRQDPLVRLLTAACRVVFFFFQAEDGIRDYKVTGVQTCALPIFAVGHSLDALNYVLGEFADLSAVSDIRRPLITAEQTREQVPKTAPDQIAVIRSEEHTSELQSPCNLVCRLLLEKKR